MRIYTKLFKLNTHSYIYEVEFHGSRRFYHIGFPFRIRQWCLLQFSVCDLSGGPLPILGFLSSLVFLLILSDQQCQKLCSLLFIFSNVNFATLFIIKWYFPMPPCLSVSMLCFSRCWLIFLWKIFSRILPGGWRMDIALQLPISCLSLDLHKGVNVSLPTLQKYSIFPSRTLSLSPSLSPYISDNIYIYII